jgi:hypothetical protein
LALGIVAAAGSARAAVSLDPFRRAGASSAAATFDPVRVAAADAPPAASSAPAAAPAPAASSTTPGGVGKACETDNDCPNETICDQKVCRAVQASTNILYLFYREGTFTEIAGLYWSKRGPSGYTFLAPLYWHTWSPKGRSHVVAPFFWRFEDYASRNVVTLVLPFAATSRSPDSSFTWIFPLNFGWRDKDVHHQLVFPLYYGTQHKKGGSFYSWFGYDAHDADSEDGSVLWLYWHGEDRKARSEYNVLFPLLWDFKDKEDRSTVFFPLVWSYGTADGNTTLAIPWFHLRRPTWQFDTLFPIWWSGRDEKAGTAFKMLVPFFYWQGAGHGRASMWVSPLGGYSRDDDARSRTLALLPLLTFWRHDPEGQIRIITPLFVQHRSYTEESRTNLYGLLLYLRSDPKGTTRALLPFFWRFRDAETGATATALLPLFARRDGPRDTTTAVGALPVLWAYWRNFKGGGWSAGLFPFAFFGSNAGRSHAVVAPLFWHWAGARDSTTVVAPFFYWHRDDRGHAGGVPLLLTFFGARDGDSYAIQFPLYWHFTSARAESSTTATPLGYYHRDRDGWSLGVGPIVPLFYAREGGKRSHAVLFPVFWHFRDDEAQRTTTVVLNFWHSRWGDRTTTALFPLLYFSQGARPDGETETTRAIFPLFYYHRDPWKTVLVTPVGFSARGPRRAGGFLGPYFWFCNEDIDARFVPLLYADISRRATGERTRQFGPFFALDGPGHKSRVLFPIFGRYEDAQESDTYVFPTFFRQRRTDGSKVDALLPLFWHSSGGGRATTVVGLFYDHTAEGVRDTGFFPFWFHARNAERSITVIPPLLFFRRHDFKTDQSRIFCLLLWHASDKDGSSTTVFPLWWQARAGAKSHAVLFPIVWHFADTAAGSSSTLAGPLYWSAHGTARTYGLLPLVWRSSDPADGSHATGVMPFFYEAHGPKRATVMTPLLGWHQSETSRFNYGGVVVPLWVSHTNLVTETHTTVVSPLLLYTRQRPDSSLTTVAGLFWHKHNVTSSMTLGLPLYYDFHDFDVSRTTVAFPVFFRHANEMAGTSLALAPLYYSHATPEGSTTVGFPLYWDFKGKDTRTTLVLPVFARWRRPGYVSTWVFPTYYHNTGLTLSGQPDGTWRTVFAPFYDAAVKRPGDFEWEVLGGLFGHENVGRNRYLKLFFIRFEQEPAPRAQTSWYSQPLRTPRRQSARGLSMNTW